MVKYKPESSHMIIKLNLNFKRSFIFYLLKLSAIATLYLNFTYISNTHKPIELFYPGTLFDANGQCHKHRMYILTVYMKNIEYISNIY